ncbi:MAG: Xaa-Pro peptidase family protein [Armatimonadota bacterium]
MSALTREKLAQAATLVRESGAHVWLTFVRETGEGSDPALPFICETGLVWISALLVGRDGRKVAVVGNYDADPLKHSGDWDEVIPYVQGIRAPLLETLESWIPKGEQPRIAVNFSEDDDKADGLTHGLFRLLTSHLEGTRFAGSLESAHPIVSRLRGLKTSEEIRRLREAITATDGIFATVPGRLHLDLDERTLYRMIQADIDANRWGYGWSRSGNPIVNFGPDSMIGHGVPSAEVRLRPGHLVHIDLGVIVDGYSSDIQRCWYVAEPGESTLPADLEAALAAVTGAIQAGANRLRPGVKGYEVDAAARSFLISTGYPEYMHALGHQVGRVAHDGGSLLGPRWERYGRLPDEPIEEGQVYTLELGVTVPGRGYLGLEEMVRVGESGIEWLSTPQRSIPVLTLNESR